MRLTHQPRGCAAPQTRLRPAGRPARAPVQRGGAPPRLPVGLALTAAAVHSSGASSGAAPALPTHPGTAATATAGQPGGCGRFDRAKGLTSQGLDPRFPHARARTHCATAGCRLQPTGAPRSHADGRLPSNSPRGMNPAGPRAWPPRPRPSFAPHPPHLDQGVLADGAGGVPQAENPRRLAVHLGRVVWGLSVGCLGRGG